MDTKNISSINFSLFFRWLLSRLHCIYRVIYIKTIPLIMMTNSNRKKFTTGQVAEKAINGL